MEFEFGINLFENRNTFGPRHVALNHPPLAPVPRFDADIIHYTMEFKDVLKVFWHRLVHYMDYKECLKQIKKFDKQQLTLICVTDNQNDVARVLYLLGVAERAVLRCVPDKEDGWALIVVETALKKHPIRVPTKVAELFDFSSFKNISTGFKNLIRVSGRKRKITIPL
jgi:hypothetical protein